MGEEKRITSKTRGHELKKNASGHFRCAGVTKARETGSKRRLRFPRTLLEIGRGQIAKAVLISDTGVNGCSHVCYQPRAALKLPPCLSFFSFFFFLPRQPSSRLLHGGFGCRGGHGITFLGTPRWFLSNKTITLHRLLHGIESTLTLSHWAKLPYKPSSNRHCSGKSIACQHSY